MKTNLRHLLLCAALAGLVPLPLAAFAENPPADSKPAVAAPTDSVSTATTTTAPAPAAAAPTATPEPSAAAAAVPAPAAEKEAPAAPAVAPAEKAAEPSSSSDSLRKLDAAPAAPEAPATPETPARPRRGHQSGNDRVAFGGNTSVAKGETANSVVAIGGNATSEGEVTDSLVAIAGNARATGPVAQSVVAIFGNAYVDGKVGEVVAVLGNVELGPNAEVRRDVVSVGGRIHRDAKAAVHGSLHESSVGIAFGPSGGFSADWLQAYLQNCIMRARPLAFGPHLAWAWYIALGFLLLYVVLGLLFGRGVTACRRTLETRPGGSILAAVLTLLLTPVLFVLLCITVVGIAVVPFLAIGLMIASLFGKAVMLDWLGSRITRYFGDGPLAHPAFSILVGGVIVLGLYLIPIVGLIVYKLLGVLGLGVVVYTLMLSSKRDKPAPTASVPTYTPPVVGVVPPTASMTGAAAAVAVEPGVATTVPSVTAVALPRAGFWIRTGALLIDVILIGILSAVTSDVLPQAMHVHPPGMLLVLAIYGAVLWKLKGTTIGGIICGLRVVRIDGRELDWATACVRALGCFLSLVVAGLGFIWVAIDDEKQSWHDKIAGTTVVQVRGNVSLV